MDTPTTELARRELVVGLRITVGGSVQKAEIPRNAILGSLYAAIGCECVDVIRLTDQLEMWIDDEGLFNSRISTRWRLDWRTISNPIFHPPIGSPTSTSPCFSGSITTPKTR